MILEIALGVVLGLLIMANLRGLIAMADFSIMVLLLLAALGGIGWLLFEAAGVAHNTIKAIPPLPEPVTAVIALVASLAANAVIAMGFGATIQARGVLSARESYLFGALFYVLFLFSAVAASAAFAMFVDGHTLTPTLYLLAIAGIWSVVLRQYSLRKRRRTFAAVI